MTIVIKQANLFDPKNNIDEEGEIYIKDGRVVKASDLKEEPDIEIKAKGLYLFPGFIDIHSHFREPGKEDAETIETGSMSAVRGGYSSVAVMPNTTPPVDNEGVARFIKEKSMTEAHCRIFPIGSISKGRKGRELSEMGHLFRAGCVAFTDDGSCVRDSSLLRRALEYVKLFDVPIIEHPEDTSLSRGGDINEGPVSTKLGLKGIPYPAESAMVGRDILLAKFTRGNMHIAHVTTEDSINLIKYGKDMDVKITSEVTPHHLLLTDKAVESFDTNTKMNPPLRSERDRKCLISALKEDIIDAIATDHAPHPDYEKELEYSLAPFGVIGLETAFPVLFTELTGNNEIGLNNLILKLTAKPASILKLPLGEIKEGATADFTLIDLEKEWTIDAIDFASRSSNCPFLGWNVKGQVEYTIVDGKLVYREGEFLRDEK